MFRVPLDIRPSDSSSYWTVCIIPGVSPLWAAAAAPGKMAGAEAMHSQIANHADILVIRFIISSGNAV
jgi:hypothetical protein